MDIAVLPVDAVPARFVARTLYEEDFVVAMRAEHPFRRNLTLDRFCEMQHLVVSLTGDAFGFVDESLAAQGLTCKVAMMDAGVSWLLDCLQEAAATRDSVRQRRHPRRSGHGAGRPQDRA
jgi:hypothetical protein